ncbi:MAG: hypothetical protein QY318_02200 [Candidatus Dojkabacteria bacterium]|nr:MAG: hypothetical protein QY318_02200 [Candidatus Dojkabacteria bacterium]
MSQICTVYSLPDENSILSLAKQSKQGDLLVEYLRDPSSKSQQDKVAVDPNDSYEYLLSFLQRISTVKRLQVDKFWFDFEYLFKFLTPGKIGSGYLFPREGVIDQDLSNTYIVDSIPHTSLFAFFYNIPNIALSLASTKFHPVSQVDNGRKAAEFVSGINFVSVASGSSLIRLPMPADFTKLVNEFKEICIKEYEQNSSKIVASKPEFDAVYWGELVDTYGEFLEFMYGESVGIVDGLPVYKPVSFIGVTDK